MRLVRLLLAMLCLSFGLVAPMHAAAMANADQACAGVMMMPHHMPAHDSHNDSSMPCCSVPAVIAIQTEIFQPMRRTVVIRPLPGRVAILRAIPQTSEPRPPKNSEL